VGDYFQGFRDEILENLGKKDEGSETDYKIV